MPRPTKEFLDYFPFYCRGDERTDVLKAKKGMIGFGVYISLLIKLYGEKGYYLNWNDTVCCIFSNNVGVSEDEVRDIISLLINVGSFDQEIYEKYGVLTSKEIQENYLFAVSKRKNKELDKRFNLVSVEETEVSGEETKVCGEETGVSVTESTQIKENKIKENKTIEKESVFTALPSLAPTPTPRGEMGNVILTEEEYARLRDKYPDSDSLIDRFSLYLASTGKSYSSHYATLVRWAQEDGASRPCQTAPGGQDNTLMYHTPQRKILSAYTKEKAAVPKRESSFEDSFELDEFFAAAVRRGQNLYPIPPEDEDNKRTPEGVRC